MVSKEDQELSAARPLMWCSESSILLPSQRVRPSKKNRLDPGRLGMAHFIDCSPVVITPATMCVIHADEAPPFEARPKRCIEDRKELTAVSDGQRELRWENGAGEVRVKLKP